MSTPLSSAPSLPLVVGRDERRLVVHFLPHAARGHDLLLLEEQRALPSIVELQPLGLSRREAEIIRWIVSGRSNAEIAVLLGIAVPTVKKHLEHIYMKLGVESRQAAAARARDSVSLRSGLH